MGVTSSRIEDDKALLLCRERKHFVKQALDGRCALAAAHVSYIQSLKKTGAAVRKFVEPEVSIESSLCTSTSATPEPLALTEKSASQFSNSSPSLSQHAERAESVSPLPSSPYSGRFQVNYMKSNGSLSKTVEERPASSVTATVHTSSDISPKVSSRSAENSTFEDPAVNSSWDFFNMHPIDDQFSFHDSRTWNHGFENGDDIRRLREEEGIPELEEEEERASVHGMSECLDSEDEFDQSSSEPLVRIFKNRNQMIEPHLVNGSAIPCEENTPLESMQKNEGRCTSQDDTCEAVGNPDSAPGQTAPSPVTPLINGLKHAEKEYGSENRVAAKDLLSSIKEIESLFLKASESGKEVPRMLEADKVNFHPLFSEGKALKMKGSTFLTDIFVCCKEEIHISQEPATNDMKYLTWHGSVSSRSSSSRNPIGATLKDDIGDSSSTLFSNICMNSGSHASTLDRLYAWERKLYDEVKASGIIRRKYDMMCRQLRHQDSRGENTYKIDKTRAAVKDLHSRIRVALHRIDSISKKIEELRDKELHPQLEELIGGMVQNVEIEVGSIPPVSSVVSPPILKQRKLRSNVWNDFEKIQKEDGHTVAKCHHCKKELTGCSKMGTTHLKSHLQHCSSFKRIRKPGQPDVGQMLLANGVNNDGSNSLECVRFDQETCRDLLAKMVIMHGIPFVFVEQHYFKLLLTNLQPQFKLVGRTSIKTDCMKVYEKDKANLYCLLKETSSRVSITADLWTSACSDSYLALTCHYINKDWKLQKRILNFVNVKSHSGANIAKVIQSKLFDWNIDGKVCSIVLDNAFSNDVLTRQLSDVLRPRGCLLMDGKLFRVRCCCHVLNLIVQVGLGPLSQTITKIRESVRHVRSSHVRLEHFRKAAEQVNCPKKKLILDVSTRWNSTYKMLAVAYEFRGAFDRLSYFDEDYKGPPSFEEWENVKIAKDCLQLFDDVTNKFSGTRYPTANLYFNDICLLHCTLRKWLHSLHHFIQAMSTCMLEKFNKYWSTLSLVLSFGCILDPRYKMKTIEFFFHKIYNEDLGSEVARRIEGIKSSFVQLYNVYADEMTKENSTTLSSTTSGDGNNSMNALVRGFSTNSVIISELLELESFLKENSSRQPSKSDLDSYLDTPVLGSCNEDFDILVWWKDNEGKYPILAMMARDILGIPISTVASESAFSTGGRILDSYRSSLNPSTVESLICCQNWLRQSLQVVPSSMLVGNFSTISLAQKIDSERFDEGEEGSVIIVDENLGDEEEDDSLH